MLPPLLQPKARGCCDCTRLVSTDKCAVDMHLHQVIHVIHDAIHGNKHSGKAGLRCTRLIHRSVDVKFEHFTSNLADEMKARTHDRILHAFDRKLFFLVWQSRNVSCEGAETKQ
jgi:hypothetical protein